MMNQCKNFLQSHILPYWKTFVIILTPILLLPLPLVIGGPEARAGYGVLLIIIYWLTSALPEAVTSLLPIVVFPLLEIMSTSDVCGLYLKESNIIFFGGVVLALGVEKSNLHRRIALRVILIVGTNPRWLMLGFMMVSTLLSMWISNAGVTAMLIPIVHAVVEELFPTADAGSEKEKLSGNNNSVSCSSTEITIEEAKVNHLEKQSSSEDLDEIKRRMKVPFFLSISYTASLGGTGTLIGSGAPLAFKGILENLYGTDTGLSFVTWMAVGAPFALVTTFVSWIWLQIIFNGYLTPGKDGKIIMRNKNDIKSSIRKQYDELGPITYYENSIIALFSLLIFLWLFKEPQFMPGWESMLPLEHGIGDATVAIAVVILAFILPSKPRFWCFSKPGEESQPSPALLDWPYVQRKFPWSVLLLLGGGYVISEASKVSGLSLAMGNRLSGLATLPPFAIMFLMCLLASAMTEIASNTAIASILLPIVAQIGEVTRMNPLYLMIPVTISCCHAFMLPVGAPSNAMVFSAGKIRPSEMLKAGAVLNIISILILCAVMETIGVAMFHLHDPDLPSWVGITDHDTTRPS